MLFLSEDEPLFRQDDRTIVDAFTLAAVIREYSSKDRKAERCLFDCEPVLGTYVKHEVLQIVAQLALHGARPEICRAVVNDLYKLLDITGTALRDGYRNLIADFMPPMDPADGISLPDPRPGGEEKGNAK